MTNNDYGVLVTEGYVNYKPPYPLCKTVDYLLRIVDRERIEGLHEVILTNYEGANREIRRRKVRRGKRKIPFSNVLGLYREKYQGKPAYIELFVDNIFHGTPKWAIRIPLIRRFLMAGVLYHEIGHHIHHVRFPEYKDKEEVAEKWKKVLSVEFIKKKYWYLVPLIYVFNLKSRLTGRKR